MTRNQIAYQEHLENVRSHKANEALQSQSLSETARSNRAREYETHRSNVVNETEIKRNNIVNAGLKQYQNETARSATQYTAEHNRVQDYLAANLQEHKINMDQSADSRAWQELQATVRQKGSSANQLSLASRLLQKQINWYDVNQSLDVVTDVVDSAAKVASAVGKLVNPLGGFDYE